MSIFLDVMEFPKSSINNFKLFDVNVKVTLTTVFNDVGYCRLKPKQIKEDIGHILIN